MHTNYNKLSAREREAAPRFYYKRTQKVTCIQRIKNILRRLIAFFFSQVGICALVAGYMVMGAFIFEHLEADSQMKQAVSNFSIFSNLKIFWLYIRFWNYIFSNQKHLSKSFLGTSSGDSPKFYRWRLGDNK